MTKIPEQEGSVDSGLGATFSRETLATRFANRSDILYAVLRDGEMSTVQAAQEKIDAFMKGKVDSLWH